LGVLESLNKGINSFLVENIDDVTFLGMLDEHLGGGVTGSRGGGHGLLSRVCR